MQSWAICTECAKRPNEVHTVCSEVKETAPEVSDVKEALPEISAVKDVLKNKATTPYEECCVPNSSKPIDANFQEAMATRRPALATVAKETALEHDGHLAEAATQ